MSRSLDCSSLFRGAGTRPRRRARIFPALLVVGLMVLGSIGLLAVVGPMGHAPAESGASLPARPAATPPTHGDLVVGPGQTYIIQPTPGTNTYYQGGNITVEAGGTLIVRNVTLSFVEYVSDSGTALERLAHIFHFIDGGSVRFYNSTLTTDVAIINAYAKLNLTVTGSLTTWNTAFEFPGWLNVEGAGASATFNDSTIAGNPNVPGLSELPALYGDTLFAPTIAVTGGAALNLFSSHIDDLYADDTSSFGYPNPPALDALGPLPLTAGAGVRLDPYVEGPSDSANLSLAWSYPSAGARSGYLTVQYVDNNGAGNKTGSNNTVSTVSVAYNGTSYSLGSVTFLNDSLLTYLIPFSAGLLNAITAAGMLNYLNYTGDYDTSPAISVAFSAVSGPAIDIEKVTFQFNTTGLDYDMSVSGTGSELSAVDSSIDINWNFPAASPYSTAAPFPWNSNKLYFTDGAVGYLANLTTPNPLPGVFSSSAVLPDDHSQVYFYRWSQFNLTGRAGILPVAGGHVAAYYAYDASESNNVTANALNDIETADPAIWGYLQYWDAQHGVAAYATSNDLGQTFVLLAAGNLTGSTLPDGQFLGGYHVGISVPATAVAPQWFNWSVSPYPTGVASGTAHYGIPDYGPDETFQDYYGLVTFSAPAVTVDRLVVAPAAVRIGQTLGFWFTANDSGTATVTQIGGSIWYNTSGTGNAVASFGQTGLALGSPGETFQFNLTWVVSQNATGLNGTYTHAFDLVLEWNNGNPSAGGGTADVQVLVTIEPSIVALTGLTSTVPSTVSSSEEYFVQGTANFNGTGQATISVYAIPSGSASPVLIGDAFSLAGHAFTVPLDSPLAPPLTPGTYTLQVQASYNTYTAYYNFTEPFTVPSSSSPTSFLDQKFLGLPLWEWLAVAGAVVVALVAFLLFARRQAAGKLVECGECGNLIPEDASVCPKCGAEFEADLIRCSRCAATIPANSKFCPECAAQLLGKPGEGGEEAERQGYADFSEKYRTEAKRELGENYSEGAFWDWWKRQPSYTSYSQWKLQQSQGAPRSGMSAPPAESAGAPSAAPPTAMPPRGRGGAGGAAAMVAPPPPPLASAAPPLAPPLTGGAGMAGAATSAPTAGGLKPCPNCGKEIPPEYLVCPFCGAVTQ